MIMGRNYRELTQDEWVELERLYPVTTNRELSRRYDISIDALVDNLAIPNGWKKDIKAVKIGSRNGRTLEGKDLAWFIKHYKHTKNADIMEKLGIGDCQLHKLARKHGLKKSKQFMRRMQANATEHAYEVCKRYGIYEETSRRMSEMQRKLKESGKPVQGGFLPCVSNKDRMSPERFRAMVEKSRLTRKKAIERDRLRLRWGLPQLTKMKLHCYGYNKELRTRATHRHLFRKRGYIVERGDNVVYYDDTTKRRPRMEANAPNYGLRVMPWEDEHESLS